MPAERAAPGEPGEPAARARRSTRRVTDDDSPNVTYLKEIWHAIQTQDISGKDALLALTQRR